MLVEYATAIPGELLRGGSNPQRRTNAKLAILSVDPDSPAWRAGLRTGHSILSVAGHASRHAEEFNAATRGIEGNATLQVYRGSERLESLSVSDK